MGKYANRLEGPVGAAPIGAQGHRDKVNRRRVWLVVRRGSANKLLIELLAQVERLKYAMVKTGARGAGVYLRLDDEWLWDAHTELSEQVPAGGKDVHDDLHERPFWADVSVC